MTKLEEIRDKIVNLLEEEERQKKKPKTTDQKLDRIIELLEKMNTVEVITETPTSDGTYIGKGGLDITWVGGVQDYTTTCGCPKCNQ
jgi:hypothetical protein